MTPACEHYGLAILFAKRWGDRVGLDFEDARQDAFLGILLALQTYDRMKGEFSRYAAYRCLHEMLQDAGSRKRAPEGRQGVFVEFVEYDGERDWADPEALDPEEALALEESSQGLPRAAPVVRCSPPSPGSAVAARAGQRRGLSLPQ